MQLRFLSHAQIGEKIDSLNNRLLENNGKVNVAITEIDTNIFDMNEDLGDQLIPLDSILITVTENSAPLKMAIAETNKFKYNRDYIKWIWLNSIQLFYNYAYGNQVNQVVASNVTTDVSTQSLGIGYRVGINIVLPLGDIAGRKARMKSLYYETEMAKHKQDDVKRAYKRQIIDDYFNLISFQKMLWVKSQDLESSRITAELALIEMKRGKIPPAELSRLRNIMAIAEAGFEQAKRDFMASFYKLETTLGVPLITYKRKGSNK
ncbi:MAG: TolC family protein [Bacteroidota bacterium]